MSSPTRTVYRSMNIIKELAVDSGDQKTYQLAQYPYLRIKHVYQNLNELTNAGSDAWTEDDTNGTITFTVARPGADSITVSYYGSQYELRGVMSISYNQSIQATAGIFSMTLDNSQGNHAPKRSGTTLVQGFSLNDVILVYIGYDENESLDFVGHVKKSKYIVDENGRSLVVTGKDKNADLLDAIVTAVFTNDSSSTIIINLLAQYAPDLGISKITTTTELITKTYNRRRLYEVLNELSLDESTKAGNFMYYVDNDDDLVYEPKASAYDKDLEIGDDISSLNITRGIYDFANVLIINGGKDLNGWTILDMWYDEDAIAEAKGQQTVRYERRENIAQQLKDGSRYDENTVDATCSLDGTKKILTVGNNPVIKFLEVSEDAAGGRAWTVVNPATDAYTEDLTAGQITFVTARAGSARCKYLYRATTLTNAEFRAEVRAEIRKQAKITIAKSGTEQWKGTVSIRGSTSYNRGNNVNVIAPESIGDDSPISGLTINKIDQTFNVSGWTTTLAVEEVIEP